MNDYFFTFTLLLTYLLVATYFSSTFDKASLLLNIIGLMLLIILVRLNPF